MYGSNAVNLHRHAVSCNNLSAAVTRTFSGLLRLHSAAGGHVTLRGTKVSKILPTDGLFGLFDGYVNFSTEYHRGRSKRILASHSIGYASTEKAPPRLSQTLKIWLASFVSTSYAGPHEVPRSRSLLRELHV